MGGIRNAYDAISPLESNVEIQKRLLEAAKQHHQVEENMRLALDVAPEHFGEIVMLYIPCEVNGVPMKAFVDSGTSFL